MKIKMTLKKRNRITFGKNSRAFPRAKSIQLTKRPAKEIPQDHYNVSSEYLILKIHNGQRQ